MNAAPGTTWFVVHAQPRAEQLAAEHLARQHYGVCFPRIRLPKLRRGQWASTVEPLFPRYLFAGVAPEQDFAPLRSTRGVACVVRFGMEYARVPAALVERLSQDAGGEGIHEFRREPFAPGERVRVLAGPFKDLEGVYAEASGHGRVRILMDIVGSRTAVTLDAGLLVPVHQSLAGAAA